MTNNQFQGMASYSYGNGNDWDVWEDSLKLGNQTAKNAGTSGLASLAATNSGISDMYKSLGLDATTEALKNPYAQGLTPDQVVGGNTGTGLWGDFKGALGGDANFGRNLLGIGQFGLGLAQYLDMKPMLEKQGKLLDQQIANNRVEMAATQDTRDRLAARAKV